MHPFSHLVKLPENKKKFTIALVLVQHCDGNLLPGILLGQFFSIKAKVLIHSVKKFEKMRFLPQHLTDTALNRYTHISNQNNTYYLNACY